MTATDRRWDTLVPLATFVIAAAVLALIAPHAPAAVDARVPIAGSLGRLIAAVASDDARALRGAAIAVVAAAATMVGAIVAAARPGWSGRLSGLVAAGWMVASPPVRAMAATLGNPTVTLAVMSALALAIDRVARGGGANAGRVIGVAGIAAVLTEARAWPALAVGAALVLYRARRGARWAPSVAAAAATTALVVLAPVALAGGPTWPSWPRGPIELAVLVDDLGPLTLALAMAGIISALSTRGDRWLCATLATVIAAGLPPAPPLGAGVVIGLAIAAGLAVAELLSRAPALRHQVVTAASVLALVAGAIAWA